MRQRGTPEQLLPEIRAVRRELTGVLTALQAFDVQLQAVAHQHDTHRRAPVTEPPHDLPTEARTLTDTVTNLNTRLGTLNARIRRSERVTTALAILLALIVIVGGYTIYLGEQVQQRSECQGQQNDASREASIQGRAASKTERDAQLAFLNVMLNPDSTDTQRANAQTTYTTTLRAANEQRQQHPFPTTNCD